MTIKKEEKCPLCAGQSALHFKSKDYNRAITNETFNHYRCLKCKVIFISPIPKNLGKYYPNAYYSIPNSLRELKLGFVDESFKIEIIHKFVKKGRLLEIGPSFGSFALLAKHSGFDVELIEQDAKCSSFLNNIVKIPTVNSDDPCNALKSLSSFDVITLWHVIEHVPNPFELIEAIATRLNSNGIVVIATPNPDAFSFKLSRYFWPHLDAPRHLMLIPSEAIIEKFKSLGIKLEHITSKGKGSLKYNIFGLSFISNLSCNPIIKNLLKIIFGLAVILLYPIEKLEGKGSCYTLVLRKV